MIKDLFYIVIISLTLMMLSPVSVFAEQSSSSKYTVKLSQSERESRCAAIKGSSINVPGDAHSISGRGIIPDAVLQGIYKTTYDISNTVARIMVLGQALTCHAVYAAKNKVTILGITLYSYPNILMWFCGAFIYFMGFMLTLSVTFYLVDIGFKLGFAVIALPIGVALYPFSWTKDKLAKIISIMLNSAAIFAFLSICVSYVYQLVSSALNGTDELFQQISENKVEKVAEKISFTSDTYILCLIALIYSLKLVGSAVKDYADKFFSDRLFGGASPIHGSLTQAMDFAKKKTLDPVVSYAKDVAKTQAGKVMSGQYNNKMKKIGHYIANPGEALNDGISVAGRGVAALHTHGAKFVNSALIDTVGRVALSKKTRTDLKNKLNTQAEQFSQKISSVADQVGVVTNKRVRAFTDKAKAAFNKLGTNISQSKIGRAASSGANAARIASNFANKRYRNTLASIKKIDRRLRNLSNKISKPINNVRDKINNGINKAENAVLKGFNAVDSVSKNVRTKVYAVIDKKVNNKAAKWLCKRAVNIVAIVNVVTKPTALVGKVATVALGSALRGTVNTAATVVKAPAAVPQTLRLIPKGLEIIVKTLNIKQVVKKTVRITGGVMVDVGDKMTRNKKTNAQIRAENARKAAEYEKQERKKRLREAQNN